MSRKPVYCQGCKNYLVLFDKHQICNENSELNPAFLNYDAYLCTFTNLENIKNQFASKPFVPMSWYPTVQKTAYREIQPNELVYFITSAHLKTKYLEVLQLLDQKGYCAYFGYLGNAFHFLNSYEGMIPSDGATLIKVLQEKGIALVIHRAQHKNLGIPSGRIFEAAAASCVIICDRNSFVLEQFGESVLYFDDEADAPLIFSRSTPMCIDKKRTRRKPL